MNHCYHVDNKCYWPVAARYAAFCLFGAGFSVHESSPQQCVSRIQASNTRFFALERWNPSCRCDQSPGMPAAELFWSPNAFFRLNLAQSHLISGALGDKLSARLKSKVGHVGGWKIIVLAYHTLLPVFERHSKLILSTVRFPAPQKITHVPCDFQMTGDFSSRALQWTVQSPEWRKLFELLMARLGYEVLLTEKLLVRYS